MKLETAEEMAISCLLGASTPLKAAQKQNYLAFHQKLNVDLAKIM